MKVSGDVRALGLAHLSGAGLVHGPVGLQPHGREHERDADHQRTARQRSGQQDPWRGVRADDQEDAHGGQNDPACQAQCGAAVTLRPGHSVNLGPGQGCACCDDQGRQQPLPGREVAGPPHGDEQRGEYERASTQQRGGVGGQT